MKMFCPALTLVLDPAFQFLARKMQVATPSQAETVVSDAAIRNSVWQGEIPVVFHLNPDEVTSLQSPEPYYVYPPPKKKNQFRTIWSHEGCFCGQLLVSRGCYFPALTSAVREHFLMSTPAVVDEMWLEYKDIPLKWYSFSLLGLEGSVVYCEREQRCFTRLST